MVTTQKISLNKVQDTTCYTGQLTDPADGVGFCLFLVISIHLVTLEENGLNIKKINTYFKGKKLNHLFSFSIQRTIYPGG